MCIICVSKPGVRQPDENTIRSVSDIRLRIMFSFDEQGNGRIRPLCQHNANVDLHCPRQVFSLPPQINGGQFLRIVHYVTSVSSISSGVADSDALVSFATHSDAATAGSQPVCEVCACWQVYRMSSSSG